MKEFVKEYFSAITFQFTFIVLLNAVLGVLSPHNFQMNNLFLLKLISMIVLLWGIAYVFLTKFDFIPQKYFHPVHFTIQILVFFLVGIRFFSLTAENILFNSLIFAALYFFTHKILLIQTKHLADKINKNLIN